MPLFQLSLFSSYLNLDRPLDLTLKCFFHQSPKILSHNHLEILTCLPSHLRKCASLDDIAVATGPTLCDLERTIWETKVGAWESLDQGLVNPHKSDKSKDFWGKSLGVVLMVTLLGLCSEDKWDGQLH